MVAQQIWHLVCWYIMGEPSAGQVAGCAEQYWVSASGRDGFTVSIGNHFLSGGPASCRAQPYHVSKREASHHSGTIGGRLPLCGCFHYAYIILQSDAPSKTLAAGLSSRIWQPFSDRSYSIYLIHFVVGVLLFKALPLIELLGGPHNKIPLMVLPVLLYSASYIAAHLLDQLVDVIALTVMGQAAARSAKLKL